MDENSYTDITAAEMYCRRWTDNANDRIVRKQEREIGEIKNVVAIDVLNQICAPQFPMYYFMRFLTLITKGKTPPHLSNWTLGFDKQSNLRQGYAFTCDLRNNWPLVRATATSCGATQPAVAKVFKKSMPLDNYLLTSDSAPIALLGYDKLSFLSCHVWLSNSRRTSAFLRLFLFILAHCEYFGEYSVPLETSCELLHISKQDMRSYLEVAEKARYISKQSDAVWARRARLSASYKIASVFYPLGSDINWHGTFDADENDICSIKEDK